MTKLTDKELNKFIKVLGAYRVKELFIQNKIQLTQGQLTYLCSIPNEERKKDK